MNAKFIQSLLFGILSLSALSTVTGSEPASPAEAAEAAIQQVKKNYAELIAHQPKKTQEIPFELIGEAMAGTLIRYEYGGPYLALQLDYAAGDHGSRSEHFYYRNGELFFILVQETHWGFAGEDNGVLQTIDTLTEIRYYLSAEQESLLALSRSASAADGDELPKLISSQVNDVIDPGADFQLLLKKGKAFPAIQSEQQVAAYLKALYGGE